MQSLPAVYFLSRKNIPSLLFALFLTACGGSSEPLPSTTPNPVITIGLTSTLQEIEAGAPSALVSANVGGSNMVPHWTLAGDVGSLSSDTGNAVEYIPPPTGSVATKTNITITASIGAVTKSLSFSVRPSTSGVYAFVGAVGGKGLLDGSGTAARFNFPLEIVADADDNLYVQDQKNGLVRKLLTDGTVGTFVALDHSLWLRLRYFSGRFLFANNATQAELIFPDGHRTSVDNSQIVEIAAYRDIDGNHYARGTTIFDGPFTRVLKNYQLLAGGAAGEGARDGIGAAARFVSISSLRVFPNKMIYVLDQEPASDKYQLRQITQEGVVSTVSGVKFESPARIIPNAGTLPIVMDRNGIHKLVAGGNWVTTPINNNNLIPGKNIQFDGADATADKNGNIYITDPNKNVIVRATAEGKVSTFAGADSNALGTYVDGKGDSARFSQPVAMARDRAGNLYVIDQRAPPPESVAWSNDPLGLTLRKISPTGVVTTLAAPGAWWGQTDNAGIAERFSVPVGMAVDSQGNIWIIDRPTYRGGSFSSNAVAIGGNTIRKISADGKLVNVNANTVSCFISDQCDIRIDSNDNVFVLDGLGVRQLDINGNLKNLAGMEAFQSVRAFYPDNKNNLYFADGSGIYKQTSTGRVSKLSNTVISTDRNQWSNRMLVDENENVYFSTDCTLRKLSATGLEAVVVGVSGQCGNRIGQLGNARLYNLSSIVTLGANSFYLTSGDAVLKIVLP